MSGESAETDELRIGELFAGYGGLGMGVQTILGGRIAWFSEFDKGPSKVLAHRFPGIPNHGDITAINWPEVEPVDVLTGGSPCQDLSTAGKRAGMTDGTRSNLWVAMREAIAQLRPSLVVWENVRGAYSAAADSAVEPCPGCVGDGSADVSLRALGRVLGDLSDLGYDAGWHGLRAADVGAPHGRFRVFVVAADTQRGGWHGRASDQVRRPFRGAAAAWRGEAARLLPSPRTSDTNGAGVHGDGGLDLRTAVSLLPTPTTTQRGTDANLDTREGARANLHNEVAKLLPTPMVGSTSPAAHGQISGQYRAQMDEAFQNWAEYTAAIHRWERLTRPAPPPTEIGPKGGSRLSSAFSEWMMGLPAGWVTDVPGVTRNEALKLCGNGVVPQQAAAAVQTILARAVAA